MALTKPRASQIYDIDYKQATRVITTTNITLTGGAPSQVDGVTLSLDDRVLVIGQSTGSQNGIYFVDAVGSGSNGTWIRATDSNSTGELLAGTIIMVTEGIIYADTQWKLTTDNPIVIGTTALTFEQNSAFAFGNVYANSTAVLATSVGDSLTLTAGNNISITGNNTSKTVTIGVTGISLNSISNGTSNVSVVGVDGDVTVGVAGTSNVVVVDNAGMTVLGNILPATDNVYTLGTADYRWANVWIGPGSLHISNTVSNTSVALSVDGAVLKVIGTAQMSVGELFFDDNRIESSTPNVDIEIGLITSAANIVLNRDTVTAAGKTFGLKDVSDGQIATLSSMDGRVVIAGAAAGLIVGNVEIFNNTIESTTGNADLIIGNTVATANLVLSRNTVMAPGKTFITTGNVEVGNLIVSANVLAAGNISATYFTGDASLMTGIAPTVQVYEFANIASGVSTYLTAQWLANYTSGPLANITVSVSTANTLITSFITQSGYPNITVLPVGTLAVLFETTKQSGNKAYTCYAEFYRRTTGGTETLLATSDLSTATAVNTLVQQTLPAFISVPVTFNDTDRIVVKIYARTSQGTDNITLSFDDNTNSGLQLPALPASAAQFVPYNNPTANVNLGQYGLSGTFVSTTGQANVGTLVVNGESTFTGNLLPSANVTYNLGSPTQRWNEIFLAANTIDIGGATISADLENGSLILKGPDGAQFLLTGTNTLNAVGHFGLIEISNAMSSHNTTSGALTVAGGAGFGGDVNIGGVANVIGNITGGNILGNGAGLSGINTFKTVAITGGNSAVANSIADTLTLSAGAGISLVMDPLTDTLTIAASSGSEVFVDGADFGTTTEIITLSDDLGSVTEAVTQEADLGALVVSGLIYPDQFVLPSYTTSTLPSASIVGSMIFVTNESAGSVPAFSDGTNWRRVTDRAIVT